MMRLQTFVLLALVGSLQALQSPVAISRRSFVAAASIFAVPTSALAAPPKREAFRGGRQAADNTHNGTDLNEKEAAVAGGLLDKMGISDAKGGSERAPGRN